MNIQINRIISEVNKINFLWTTIFFLLCLSLNLSSEIYSQESSEKLPSGKDLFIKNRCVNCHTIGRGRFVGPDLAGVGSRYSKEEIEQWMGNPQLIYQSKGKMPINEGYPPMPPLEVSPEEAGFIADYLLSVKTPTVSKAKGGVIKGMVVNATSEETTKGIELTLMAYLGDRPTDQKKVKTASDGSFNFSNLAWDRSYTISLNYKGA
ncbi:MAG: cytochrome c, partial [Deltaproteobacteria bacterium]|nr:cytochrome c [Deltaproteobacteria bacterium]